MRVKGSLSLQAMAVPRPSAKSQALLLMIDRQQRIDRHRRHIIKMTNNGNTNINVLPHNRTTVQWLCCFEALPQTDINLQ